MADKTPAIAEPALSIRNLHKSFGALNVLRGVTLDVAPSENVAVLGRSGSGKSVLIKLAVALLAPDEGTVHIFGKNVHALPRKPLDELRRRVGFSFQSSALYDSMDVFENLAFPLRMNIKGLSMNDVKERVGDALEAVGLASSIRKMPSELSGGQRKRIGIARTLILRPELMLYDEPTSGLDPITSGEINDLIREVQETYNTASIIITHDLACARHVGDRLAILMDGALVEVGTFDEVFASDDARVRAFYNYNFMQAANP